MALCKLVDVKCASLQKGSDVTDKQKETAADLHELFEWL